MSNKSPVGMVAEVKALRGDERLGTEAIINGNFLAHGVSSDKMTKEFRQQTLDLAFNSKLSVGIA
jgi:hypothetical protein